MPARPPARPKKLRSKPNHAALQKKPKTRKPLRGEKKHPAAERRTANSKQRSPRGDIHRNFKPETHIGVTRGSPLHIRPPSRVKKRSLCGEQTSSTHRSAHVANATVVPVACDQGRTRPFNVPFRLTRLTVAEPQQSVPRADHSLWTHFASCARVLTDRLSLLKKIVNSLRPARRLH